MSAKLPRGPWTNNDDRDVIAAPGDGRVIVDLNCGELYPEEYRPIADLIAAAPELLAACKFIKAFLVNLERAIPEADPLLAIRRRVHAPLHEKLDAAIAKAEGRSSISQSRRRSQEVEREP